jgi:hypothetical protein
MPNICLNTIEIKGPSNTINNLMKKAERQDDVPALLESMAPLGSKDKVDTDNLSAIAAWGTKWDLMEADLKVIDNDDGTSTIKGWVNTAWSPPIEAFETFINNNADVDAEILYYEPGMGFGGHFINNKDTCIEDLYDMYQLPEQQRSETFNTLNDYFEIADYYEE